MEDRHAQACWDAKFAPEVTADGSNCSMLVLPVRRTCMIPVWIFLKKLLGIPALQSEEELSNI
jgi:hypothetical protein